MFLALVLFLMFHKNKLALNKDNGTRYSCFNEQMKWLVFLSFASTILISGCANVDSSYAVQFQDTIAPIIKLNGRIVDTAYLHAPYNDRGAGIYDDRDGIAGCNDFTLMTEYSGEVNTHIPGIYYLQYNAKDSLGNPLTSITRTVHVVENNANFLVGNYGVVCTCTAVSSGSSNYTVTTESYTSTIIPGTTNNYFEIITLNIGRENVIPSTMLKGSLIEVGNLGLRDYHSASNGSGTLSATKNTFTIESIVYPFSPAVIYKCKNIFTKALTQDFK